MQLKCQTISDIVLSSINENGRASFALEAVLFQVGPYLRIEPDDDILFLLLNLIIVVQYFDLFWRDQTLVSAVYLKPFFNPPLIRIWNFWSNFDATFKAWHLLNIQLRILFKGDVVDDVLGYVHLWNFSFIFCPLRAFGLELDYIILFPLSIVILVDGAKLKLFSIFLYQMAGFVILDHLFFFEALLIGI